MKLGLALSGGGIKGLAHAGVIKALEENEIKIDIIGGTSAGSMVSILYAIGYTPDEIYKCFKDNYTQIIGKKKFPIFDSLKRIIGRKTVFNYFKTGAGIEEIFNKLADERGVKNISEIKMPIVIPTVDIMEAKEYVFTNYIPNDTYIDIEKNATGSKSFYDGIKKQNVGEYEKYLTNVPIGKAIRASSSFPAMFDLCTTIEKHIFIDGGTLDNVPTAEVKKQGADKVISVKFDENQINERSGMVDIIMRTIDIMGNKIIEQDLEKSDFLLNIHIDKVGLLDTECMEQCFNCGYEAVINNLDKIKEILNL